MKHGPLAAIDIGTNTFRLLIANILCDESGGFFSFEELHSGRIITRLGQGLHKTGLLGKDAMDRGIAALKDFRDAISNQGVYKTYAVATSALRVAGNSGEFIKKAKDKTGLDIMVISGSKEAELTAMGMLMDMVIPETALMVDIGGGSTELIFTRGTDPHSVLSIDLGVVHLAGKYMTHDPPLPDDLDKMDKEISDKLSFAAEDLQRFIGPHTAFHGTAGTITALAAMAQGLETYEHDKIHTYTLTLSDVADIYSAISLMHSAERAKYIPFETSRLDIIVPGTRILLNLMEMLEFTAITVSNYGLREGILVELYRESSGNRK